MSEEEREQAEAEEPTEEPIEKPIEKKDPDLVLLQAKIGSGLLAARAHCGQISAQVAPGALLDAARFLRDERGYKLLSFVCGVDCLELPVSYRFKVTYSLLNLEKSRRLRVEVPCADDLEPTVPSVCGIWPGAKLHESEAYDLLGINFEGHPELERILTPEGFEGHPHRKDFDISSEPVAFTFRDTPAGKPKAAE